MFSYILVVLQVSAVFHILLISTCPMLKVGKLNSIANSAILESLLKNYFKDAKIWSLFGQLYKNSVDCFVLEVSTVDTVSRFQSRICIAIQEKEIKTTIKRNGGSYS